MLTNLLRPRSNRRLINDLHDRIVAAARRPALFLPPYAVPDTLDGRFDLLVLLTILVLRRLESLPEPGPEIAQELVNAVFDRLDADLREMGVGDLAVPKRMKKLAGAFAGRSAAYREALDRNGTALATALARNIYAMYAEKIDCGPDALAAYCRETVAALERTDLIRILADPPFPDPDLNDARSR
jgi:cytochrome b pre-mRNA-processing protein 3